MKRRTILTLLTGGLGLVSGAGWAAGDHRTDARNSVPAPTSRDAKSANAPVRTNLRTLGSDGRVRSISHIRGSYRVVTVDGNAFDFHESDLRFKVDSSDAGPARGSPVVLFAGPVGDRAWVFFAGPEEISAFIT